MSTGSKAPLDFDEVVRTLRKIQSVIESGDAILVGGQAVAFWTARYRGQSGLSRWDRPPTSGDTDFCGNRMTVSEIATLLDGFAYVATMDSPPPSAGYVEYEDTSGNTRIIDVLYDIYGLTTADLRATAIPFRVEDPDGGPAVLLRVMHPERCMESRVKNVMGLNQAAPRNLDQLEASIACASEFSRELLDSPESFGLMRDEAIRTVLALNKRVFRFSLNDLEARALYRERGIDPFDACLLDHPLLPDAVRTECVPRWRQRLKTRRAAASGSNEAAPPM